MCEQSEHREQSEQPEQFQHREQSEQREQREQREQPEQYEQSEQPEQSFKLARALRALSSLPQYSTEQRFPLSSVIQVIRPSRASLRPPAAPARPGVGDGVALYAILIACKRAAAKLHETRPHRRSVA